MYVCTSEILAQHCRRFTVDVPIFERGKKSSGIHESRSRIPEGMSCSGSIEAEKDFFVLRYASLNSYPLVPCNIM
jgi:hypothetical protein